MALSLSLMARAENNSIAKEAAQKIFPTSQNITSETLAFDGREIEICRVFAKGEVIGWAVVLDEMGKVKPITFLVGIDVQGKVTGVIVLEYRDIFGSEIKRRSFLRQFQNKSLKDRIAIGADIDAVTSATISSNAATSAVRKALNIVAELKK